MGNIDLSKATDYILEKLAEGISPETLGEIVSLLKVDEAKKMEADKGTVGFTEIRVGNSAKNTSNLPYLYLHKTNSKKTKGRSDIRLNQPAAKMMGEVKDVYVKFLLGESKDNNNLIKIQITQKPIDILLHYYLASGLGVGNFMLAEALCKRVKMDNCRIPVTFNEGAWMADISMAERL